MWKVSLRTGTRCISLLWSFQIVKHVQFQHQWEERSCMLQEPILSLSKALSGSDFSKSSKFVSLYSLLSQVSTARNPCTFSLMCLVVQCTISQMGPSNGIFSITRCSRSDAGYSVTHSLRIQIETLLMSPWWVKIPTSDFGKWGYW